MTDALDYRPRPPHDPDRGPDEDSMRDRLVRVRAFPGCQFLGYLDGGLEQLRSGSWRVQLTVPPEFASEIWKLRVALGVPLSVDVRAWDPRLQDEPSWWDGASDADDGSGPPDPSPPSGLLVVERQRSRSSSAKRA